MKNRGEDSSGKGERAQERNAPRAWSRIPPSGAPQRLPPFPGPVRWEGNRNILECQRGLSTLLRSWLIQGSGMGEVIHPQGSHGVSVPKDSERSRSLQPPSPKVSRALAVGPDSGPFKPRRRERTLSVSPGSLPTFLAVASYFPSPVSVHSAAAPDSASPPLFSVTGESLLWGAATAIAQDAPSDNPPDQAVQARRKARAQASPSPRPAVLVGMFPVASGARPQPRRIVRACTDGAGEKKGEGPGKGATRGTDSEGI